MSANCADPKRSGRRMKIPKLWCPSRFPAKYDYTNTWAGGSLIHQNTQKEQCIDLGQVTYREDVDNIVLKGYNEQESFPYQVRFDWLFLVWTRLRDQPAERKKLQKLQLNLIEYLNNKGLWNPLFELIVGLVHFYTRKKSTNPAPKNHMLRKYHLLWFCSVAWENFLNYFVDEVWDCIREKYQEGDAFRLVGGLNAVNLSEYIGAMWDHCNLVLQFQGLNTHYNARNDQVLEALHLRKINLLTREHWSHGEIVKKFRKVDSKTIMLASQTRTVQAGIQEVLHVAAKMDWCMNECEICHTFKRENAWNMTAIYPFDGYWPCEIKVTGVDHNNTIEYKVTDGPEETQEVPPQEREEQISTAPWIEGALFDEKDNYVNEGLQKILPHLTTQYFGILGFINKWSKMETVAGLAAEPFEQLAWSWHSPEMRLTLAAMYCVMAHRCKLPDTRLILIPMCLSVHTYQVAIMYALLNQHDLLDGNPNWMDVSTYRWLHDWLIMVILEDRRSLRQQQTTTAPVITPADWYLLATPFKCWQIYHKYGIDWGLKIMQVHECLYTQGEWGSVVAMQKRSSQCDMWLQAMITPHEDLNQWYRTYRQMSQETTDRVTNLLSSQDERAPQEEEEEEDEEDEEDEEEEEQQQQQEEEDEDAEDEEDEEEEEEEEEEAQEQQQQQEEEIKTEPSGVRKQKTKKKPWQASLEPVDESMAVKVLSRAEWHQILEAEADKMVGSRADSAVSEFYFSICDQSSVAGDRDDQESLQNFPQYEPLHGMLGGSTIDLLPTPPPQCQSVTSTHSFYDDYGHREQNNTSLVAQFDKHHWFQPQTCQESPANNERPWWLGAPGTSMTLMGRNVSMNQVLIQRSGCAMFYEQFQLIPSHEFGSNRNLSRREQWASGMNNMEGYENELGIFKNEDDFRTRLLMEENLHNIVTSSVWKNINYLAWCREARKNVTDIVRNEFPQLNNTLKTDSNQWSTEMIWCSSVTPAASNAICLKHESQRQGALSGQLAKTDDVSTRLMNCQNVFLDKYNVCLCVDLLSAAQNDWLYMCCVD